MTAFSLGAAMAGSKSAKRERRANDFYPTPWEATAALAVAERHRLAGRRIWEPACGDGAMARELEARGLDVAYASDLIDRGYGLTGADFLSAELPPGVDAIVTNPPFSHADRFIRHALGTLQVPYLALLLKATYWHAANRAGLHRRFPPTAYLPCTWRIDFTGERASTMDLCWYVWDAEAAGTVRYELLPRPAAHPLGGIADLFGAAA